MQRSGGGRICPLAALLASIITTGCAVAFVNLEDLDRDANPATLEFIPERGGASVAFVADARPAHLGATLATGLALDVILALTGFVFARNAADEAVKIADAAGIFQSMLRRPTSQPNDVESFRETLRLGVGAGAAGLAVMIPMIDIALFGTVMSRYLLVNPLLKPSDADGYQLRMSKVDGGAGNSASGALVLRGMSPLASLSLPAEFLDVPLKVDVLDGVGRLRFSGETRVQDHYWAPYLRPTEPPRLRTLLLLNDRATSSADPKILVKVTNLGPSPASEVVVKIQQSRQSDTGLAAQKLFRVGDLAPGESLTLPVEMDPSGLSTSSFSVSIVDAYGFDAKEEGVSLATPQLQVVSKGVSLATPQLQVVSIGMAGLDSDTIRPGVGLVVQVRVRNGGNVARTAQLRFYSKSPDVMVLTDGQTILRDIAVKGEASASFSVFIRNAYKGPPLLPLWIVLEDERRGSQRQSPVDARLGRKIERLPVPNVKEEMRMSDPQPTNRPQDR